MPTDLSPAALQKLAAQGLSQVLLALRDNPGPLGDALERLIQQHWSALSAAPEQLLLQLAARLPRTPDNAAWIEGARAEARAAGLELRSQTLAGPQRVERWTRKPHSALVHALVQLPDGDTVVSAGEDGQLLAWSLSNDAAPPEELGGHQGPVNHLALSADGAWLASAGDDQQVGLWSLEGGRPGSVKLLQGHGHYVRQVAFGPQVLASASQDGTVKVWAVPSGKLLQTLEHGQDVMSLAISSDGALLASSTINSALHLWNLNSGQKVGSLYGNDEQVLRVMGDIYLSGTNRGETGHKDYPRALGFADGDTVLWSMGTELIVWDLATRAERVHHAPVTQFNAHELVWLDGERAAVAGNGLHLVRARRGDAWLAPGELERLGTLGAGRADATALRLLADGRTLLSGHNDGSVTAWDLTVDPRSLPEAEHGGPVWELDRSPTGRYLVSKAGDNSVRVWDAETGRCLDRTALTDPNSYGGWCAFSPDERLLALADGKGQVQLRELPGGGGRSVKIEHEKSYQAVSAVGFAAEPGVLYAGLATAGLFRLTLTEPARVEPFRGYAASPARIAALPVGRQLVIEDNFAPSEQESDWQENRYQLLGFDGATLERRFRVSAEKPGEGEFISFGDPVLLPEGLLTLSGTREPRLVLRDPTTGEVTRELDLPARWFGRAQRLEDGRLFLLVQLAEKGPSVPTLLDVGAGRVLHQWEDPKGWSTVDIRGDGRLAIRVGEGGLEVYAPQGGAVRHRFFADAATRHARFGRGGLLLAADASGLVHVLAMAD